MFLHHLLVKVSIVGSLRDREVFTKVIFDTSRLMSATKEAISVTTKVLLDTEELITATLKSI